MSFAVLQRRLDRLDPARMAAAFERLPGWQAHDAAVIARDQDGVIAQGLSAEQAKRMTAALRGEGIDVEAVDERELITTLPPIRRVRRLDALPQSLIVYDALGRPTSVAWQSVMVVSAGLVSRTAFERGEELTYGAALAQGHTPVRERQLTGLMGELILDATPRRCRFEATNMQYVYLGDRRARSDGVANFLTLLGDLRRYARAAMFGRGAATLVGASELGCTYRNRTTFEEEITWMLWRLSLTLAD